MDVRTPYLYHVMFGDGALEDVCMAALEAYACGDGRRRSGTKVDRDGLETFGHLWGNIKLEAGVLTFYVAKAAVDLAAYRDEESCAPHGRSGGMKKRFMDSWAPHLTMLGDFHSHPYRSLDEVIAARGHGFSPEDVTFIKDDDDTWETTGGNRLMIAVTVCKLARVHPSSGPERVSDRTVRFDVGEYRFWLNAMVGYRVAGERLVAPDDDRSATGRDVVVDLDSRFYNSGAQRLEDVKGRR